VLVGEGPVKLSVTLRKAGAPSSALQHFFIDGGAGELTPERSGELDAVSPGG